MKRASSYAERLQLPLAVIHGEEKLAEHDTDDGRTSPPLVDSGTESITSLHVGSRITHIDVHNLPGNMLFNQVPAHWLQMHSSLEICINIRFIGQKRVVCS